MQLTYEEALELMSRPQHNPQKGTKMIDNWEYIIIPHKFMCMNISANELHAFCLIYGICTNCESHTFVGSNNYVATRINCSIPYANKTLTKLQEKGLIIKVTQENSQGTCTYVLPDNLDSLVKQYSEE